jgi:hypothetical protein
MVCEAVEAAPALANAQRLRVSQVEKLLKGHRIPRIGVVEVIGVLKQPGANPRSGRHRDSGGAYPRPNRQHQAFCQAA